MDRHPWPRPSPVCRVRRIMAIDCDVEAVAQLMVARHGSRARVYAALRVGKLHAPGDASIRQLWMAVVSAIDDGGGLGVSPFA